MAMAPSSSPNLSLKNRLFCISYAFVLDWIFRSNFAAIRRLATLFDLKTFSAYSSPAVSASDVCFHSTRRLWFRLFTPTASPAKLPLVVYFHGGGFASLAANSIVYDDFCRRLARDLPAAVASVNYRLAPDHKFPAQHEDGFDVLRLLDETECLPEIVDLGRCFLAGDSAGANIAHHVALRACNEHEFRNLKIRGLVSVQPFFGGEERTESEIRNVSDPILNVDRTDWMWRTWLPDGSDRDHPAVNVCGPKAVDIRSKKFPGTVVFAGGFDPLLDWQRRYGEWLKRSGKEVRVVEYPGGIHGFCVFPDLPESGFLINEVARKVSMDVLESYTHTNDCLDDEEKFRANLDRNFHKYHDD